MNWLPSRRMPPIPYYEVDWKLRAALGRRGVTDLWEKLWEQGVNAGRAEGVVATLLVVFAVILIIKELRRDQ